MRHWDADTPKTNVVKTQNMTKTTNQNHEHDQPIFEINKHEITSHPPIPPYQSSCSIAIQHETLDCFFSLCWINIIKNQKKKLWIIVFNIQKLPITQYEVFIIEVYNELSRVTLLWSSSVVCVSSVDISLVPMFQFYMGDLSTICTTNTFTFHDTPEKQFQTQQSS